MRRSYRVRSSRTHITKRTLWCDFEHSFFNSTISIGNLTSPRKSCVVTGLHYFMMYHVLLIFIRNEKDEKLNLPLYESFVPVLSFKTDCLKSFSNLELTDKVKLKYWVLYRFTFHTNKKSVY